MLIEAEVTETLVTEALALGMLATLATLALLAMLASLLAVTTYQYN